MNNTYRKALLTFLFFMIIFTIPRTAHAYIGPGTLTLVLQVLAGLLVGGVTVIAIYWGKIKDRLSKNKKEEQQ